MKSENRSESHST